MDNITTKSTKRLKKRLLEYHIWLVVDSEEVFLINLPKDNILKLNDITIVSTDTSRIIKVIEDRWGILCQKANLVDVYNYEFERTEIRGLLLKIVGGSSVKNIVFSRNTNGLFINYRDLDDRTNKYERDDNFKEALYSLIGFLDK